MRAEPFPVWAFRVSPEHFAEACGDRSIGPVGQLIYQFEMAFRAFSMGQRAVARTHLEKCISVGYPAYEPYHWSKAFCQLMDANPDWPVGCQHPHAPDE